MSTSGRAFLDPEGLGVGRIATRAWAGGRVGMNNPLISSPHGPPNAQALPYDEPVLSSVTDDPCLWFEGPIDGSGELNLTSRLL